MFEDVVVAVNSGVGPDMAPLTPGPTPAGPSSGTVLHNKPFTFIFGLKYFLLVFLY